MKTEELEAKIKRTKRLDMQLIQDNAPPSFAIYMQELITQNGIKRSELIKALNVDRNYGYQMINGTRTPTRIQLLRMALYMKLDLKCTQRLLNLAGREALYVRRPEDAKTVHCLEHPMDYKRACEFIWGE